MSTPEMNSIDDMADRRTRILNLLEQRLRGDEFETPKRRSGLSGSFNARVLDLAIGESCAKLRAVDPTCSVERLTAELPSMREQVRNSTTPAVRNAKERIKDSAYSIEVGDLLMPSGVLFVVAVVTRTA